MTYEEFLKTKDLERIEAGFDVQKGRLNKALFPFQKDMQKLFLILPTTVYM